MAATNTLSDTAIRAAIKAAAVGTKPQTLNDGGGLSLLVQPTGGAWWWLRCRLDSRENRLSLGTYPETGLPEARQRRRGSQAHRRPH